MYLYALLCTDLALLSSSCTMYVWVCFIPDECSLNPDACLYGGTCTDEVNDYTCSCTSGYTGNNCETTPDWCTTGSMCNGNVCFNSLDDGKAVCGCDTRFYTPGM